MGSFSPPNTVRFQPTVCKDSSDDTNRDMVKDLHCPNIRERSLCPVHAVSVVTDATASPSWIYLIKKYPRKVKDFKTFFFSLILVRNHRREGSAGSREVITEKT